MVKKDVLIDGLTDTITSDDILGKEVIDAEGGFVGVVENVLIDPETVEIIGISIDNGLLKKGLLVGKNYIKNVAKHAVFLKINSAFNLKGMFVFDIEGKKVGKIYDLQLYGTKNKIQNIFVRSDYGNIEISSKFIEI